MYQVLKLMHILNFLNTFSVGVTVAAIAQVILEHLCNVYAQTKHTQLKAALDSCITSYTKIWKELVPEAIRNV